MHVDSIARTRAPLSSKLCLNNASTWSWRSSLRPINRIGYCAPPEISSCEPDCDARSYTIFPRTTFCSEMARSMAASRRSSSARRSATSRSKASRRWRISPRPMGTLCLPTTVHPLSRGHQYNIATPATAPPAIGPNACVVAAQPPPHAHYGSIVQEPMAHDTDGGGLVDSRRAPWWTNCSSRRTS